MPAAFDKCVADGGKVRTITGPRNAPSLKTGEYIHVCSLNGKTYFGYKKKKKKE